MEKEEKAIFYLKRLLIENEFELWRTEDMSEKNWKVTYMFNDAVESYLLLEEVILTGEYKRELENLELDLIEEENRYGVRGRQSSGNCFVVWFSKIQFICELYAYDEIGHFWVKGVEHFRQLVYEIGLIQDKWEYLGSEYCSKKEQELLHLLEFAPFRSYYSVPWEMEEDFFSTREGIHAFQKIWKEVSESHKRNITNKKYDKYEKKMKRLLIKYEKNGSKHVEKRIHKLLNCSGYERYYWKIREKVMEASGKYSSRSFPGFDKQIAKMREKLENTWKKEGWRGSYPDYEKRIGRKILRMHIVEEQPFTTEKMRYRFHGMISKCTKREMKKLEKIYEDKRKASCVNVGFFKGRGKGWIQTWEVKLEEKQKKE